MAFRDKPKGFLRWFLRAPIWLYRTHLGWMMGNRFVMLHHIGRNSGLTRYAVIEVVYYDKERNEYTIASGWGTQSDWYRNIVKTPEVKVSTYKGEMEAKAIILSVREGTDALKDYAQRHPAAFRTLMKSILGSDYTGVSDIDSAAEKLPVVKLQMMSEK